MSDLAKNRWQRISLEDEIAGLDRGWKKEQEIAVNKWLGTDTNMKWPGLIIASLLVLAVIVFSAIAWFDAANMTY